MKLTWVLVNYFVHCPRQARLFYYNIKSEHTSEDVKIWKILHQLRYWENNYSEIEFIDEGIKIDKINFKWKDLIEIEEFKKSNKQLRAQIFQLLFYLFKFKNLGLENTIWKLIFDENHKINFNEIKDLDYEIDWDKIFIKLTSKNENKLKNILDEIEKLLKNWNIPPKIKNKSWWPHKNCKGCSYFELCWI